GAGVPVRQRRVPGAVAQSHTRMVWLRGGSWSTNRWSARCSSRHNGNRTATSPAAGFRCTLFAAPASPQEL
ncbi:MAG: hypothetical protein KAX24_04470, partial [Anaerolineae bacterium]|nr:hypothetical protein [Anaerolineae bacterium]